MAQPLGGRAQKQPDIGFTEAVDGLHRVAHQKQRPPIAGHPLGGQAPEDLVLRGGGVLELVDEQVFDPGVERLGERGGRLRQPQGEHGGHGDFGVVGLAPGLKEQLQFGCGPLQHLKNGGDDLPLRVGQFGGWQRFSDEGFELRGGAAGLGPFATDGAGLGQRRGLHGGPVLRDAAGRGGGELGEVAVRHGAQGAFNAGAVDVQVAQPLVAPGEHLGELFSDAAELIVEVRQQTGHGGVAVLDGAHGFEGGEIVQLGGILGDLRRRS